MGAAKTTPNLRGLRTEPFAVDCKFVERVVEYIQVVDVRGRAQQGGPRIPGSLPVRMAELYQWMFDRDRELPVILVCEDGSETSKLCSTLQTFGFPNVAKLEGGVARWVTEGRELK